MAQFSNIPFEAAHHPQATSLTRGPTPNGGQDGNLNFLCHACLATRTPGHFKAPHLITAFEMITDAGRQDPSKSGPAAS